LETAASGGTGPSRNTRLTASLTRAIAALSAAAFISAATMRVADPLVPQIAHDLATTPGSAAIVATAFSLAYGLCQLGWGPLGDRFGKFAVVTITMFISAALVAAPAFTDTLLGLGFARALGGATAAAAIPLAMAFIGDHVPYEERQTVLARFLTGQILGVIAGQALGGILGDYVSWRAVFLLLGGGYFLVGLWLVLELRSGRLPPPLLGSAQGPARLASRYIELLQRPWARIVVATVFVEGAAFYGGLAFIGAYAHDHFGLAYSTVGLVLCFFGLGGFAYALAVRPLIRRYGERGLARLGGALLAAGFAAMLVFSTPLVLPPAMVLLGLGFYMLHNTLQTNATQMAPEARGLAVSTFAAALFLGQAVGVAALGAAVDTIGYLPAFAIAGVILISLGVRFAQLIDARPQPA
jgi:MFS transporter, YNFM family, putative membrane transport protein